LFEVSYTIVLALVPFSNYNPLPIYLNAQLLARHQLDLLITKC